jgi:hypothetical protein
MVRRNFGRTSGVIVDLCGSHGVWFDAQELAHVLRWIRSGNLEAARVDLASLRQSPDLARKRQAAARPPANRRPARTEPTEGTSNQWDHPLADVAEGVLWVLGQLF